MENLDIEYFKEITTDIRINKQNISNKLKQIMKFIRDIALHIIEIMKNDTVMSTLSYQFQVRIDYEERGFIDLKQLLAAFGNETTRIDSTLEKEFKKLCPLNKYIIDRNDFKKFMVKGLEILLLNLYTKTEKIIEYSNSESEFQNFVSKEARGQVEHSSPDKSPTKQRKSPNRLSPMKMNRSPHKNRISFGVSQEEQLINDISSTLQSIMSIRVDTVDQDEDDTSARNQFDLIN